MSVNREKEEKINTVEFLQNVYLYTEYSIAIQKNEILIWISKCYYIM